jgi:hypothetical protein
MAQPLAERSCHVQSGAGRLSSGNHAARQSYRRPRIVRALNGLGVDAIVLATRIHESQMEDPTGQVIRKAIQILSPAIGETIVPILALISAIKRLLTDS